MTDPRLGDGLLAVVRKLPTGSGVIFRHYDLQPAVRRSLFRQVRRICRQRGHMLLVAGDMFVGGDGKHGRTAMGRSAVHSAPVHDAGEIRQAIRLGVNLVFLSPLYPTRSHPGARGLGLLRFAALAKLARPAKVIALGGVTKNKARMLKPHLAHGWAAIDAFKK